MSGEAFLEFEEWQGVHPVVSIDGEARENRQRNGMAGKLGNSRWRVLVFGLADGQAVITDNDIATTDNIGLGGVCTLIDERKALEKAIQLGLAAIERLGVMVEPELLDR